MFNQATGPNMKVGLLGTRPCDLIATRPRGGSWDKGGLLGQLDWAKLIRRPWLPWSVGTAMAASK
jgi:hypothetical protein